MIKQAQSESYWIHHPIRPRGAYAKSSGVRGNSPICCGVLQARADLSMLWMNSPWPWGSHQFCMRSPHQIDWGLYCSSGSPGFPWGQTPTETAVATQTTYCSLSDTHTHTHTHAHMQSLELIMEIQLLTRVLSTVMFSRLLLLLFNKLMFVWPSSQM